MKYAIYSFMHKFLLISALKGDKLFSLDSENVAHGALVPATH